VDESEHRTNRLHRVFPEKDVKRDTKKKKKTVKVNGVVLASYTNLLSLISHLLRRQASLKFYWQPHLRTPRHGRNDTPDDHQWADGGPAA
jgi:hypothetical protein